MPTFVEITPDPFATHFRGMTVGDPNEDGSDPGFSRAIVRSFDHVRRPVRGTQLKEDTYATIQVYTADGRNIPLVDAGGNVRDTDNPDKAFSFDYSNFLLQEVQEQRAEKMQIVQTFGETFAFFFGEQPRMISFSGVLLNTEDFNWRAEFWENYDKYLRGTKCVQSKTRVSLSWDDIVIEGYFVTATASETAINRNSVTFQFTMLLTNYHNISRIGSSEFPSSGQEIQLDPYSLDTTGEGIGNLASTTQLVRSLNTAQPAGKKNSLLQNLRDATSAVMNLDGQLASLFDLASRFLYGRNIRVPVGYAGGSVYDQETQIALASVSAKDRQIVLRSRLGNQDFTIRAPLDERAFYRTHGPVPLHNRIQDNLDEYIARNPVSATGRKINPPDLFADQKMSEDGVRAEVDAVFKKFKVSTEPPDEAVLLARRVSFGILSVAVGAAAQESKPLANLIRATNLIF